MRKLDKFDIAILTTVAIGIASLSVLIPYSVKEEKAIKNTEKLLAYEANMDIDAHSYYSIYLHHKIAEDGQYLLNFTYNIHNQYNSISGVEYEVIYSVDKDTYFNFVNNFNKKITYQGQYNMLKELAEKYDPIRSYSHKQENEDGLKF